MNFLHSPVGPGLAFNAFGSGQLPSSRALSRTSGLGRKLRHYRKAPAKAIAAAPERLASGNQCERIRKLISRWHRDELGAERKAARRKCSKASAPILDIIRKNAVHAALKAADAYPPHDTPSSLSHLEASRALLRLAAALRAGGP